MLTLPAYAVTNAFVVTGEVIDAVNNPLPGVNVVEKGTRNGTITDVDGKFELTLKDGNAILSFSYIGFTSIDVPVENKQNLRVKMREDVTQMDEVVVIGYGTTTKKEVTGSISSLKEESFVKRKYQQSYAVITRTGCWYEYCKA